MKTFIACLLTLTAAIPAAAQTPVIEYRFDEVKRKVVLTTPKTELRVERGQHAQSGDKVQTGWFSYALIASERHRARFEIFSATDVLLTAGEPGVLLSLERGRLRAAFDKITGNEPRVVKTPGALLAVRGTQYEVDVDKTGQTTLKVYEGIVEVRSELRREPLLVHAGEASTYSRREPPVSRPMPPGDRGSKDPNHRGDGDSGRGQPRGDGQNHPQQPPPGAKPPVQPQPPSPKPGGHH